MSLLVAPERPGTKLAARFRLRLRCESCVRESQVILDVPSADEAPTDIDELMESAFLERQRFVCPECEGLIGAIASVAKLRLPEAA